jgi:hypothetical protein
MKRLLDDVGHVLRRRVDEKEIGLTRPLAFRLNFEPVPKAMTGISLPSLRGTVGTDMVLILLILF